MDSRQVSIPSARLWPFALAVLAVQLPLVLNPGYFSHDELQWLARSATPDWASLPWSGWFDFSPFQFRPLTFNLWLVLSRLLGTRPMAMHAVFVLIGSGNAWLLRAVLCRLGAGPRHAGGAVLLFVLSSYVVSVHGWVGTLADLLCLAAVLGALLWLCRRGTRAVMPSASHIAGVALTDMLPVAALSWLALCCKESAVVLPALLLCAWPCRGRRLLPAIAASGAVVLAYLLLRADVILFAPRTAGIYTWHLTNVPARSLDYALFPFVPQMNDVVAMRLLAGWRLWLALACVLTLVGVAARTGWRRPLMLGIGWLAALGPVLILDGASNVYAYLASAFVCGAFALWMPDLGRPARFMLAVPVLVGIIHGAQIARGLQRVGHLQERLCADLVILLREPATPMPMRIRADSARDEEILRRLLHDVPSYAGVPIDGRVTVVSRNEPELPATHRMDGDGALTAIPATPP